jgi:hypothetical protein
MLAGAGVPVGALAPAGARRACRFLAAWRVAAVAAALAVLTAVITASPVIASASATRQLQPRPEAQALPGSGITLARAPAGLRAAVRRTLGRPTAAAGSSFQQAKLIATDAAAGDQSGSSVAIYGSTAVVGAPGKNGATGAAYVFTRSGSTWTQQAKLTATGAAAGDEFGFSVALSGSTAVVGAYRKNGGTGAAYVFARSGSTWTQQAKLTATGAAPGDFFGSSVALSGSTAVIGALGENSFTGAVYVFTGSGSTWTQRAELTADAAPGDDFGYSVALSGSTAVVGAYAKNSSAGAVYVFTGSGATWSWRAELTAADAAPGDDFGYSVALSGSTAVIGAPLKNGVTGAAYVFTGSGATWAQQAELTAADATTHDDFGWSVALSGSTAVVGAAYTNNWAGAAYVFTAPGGTWTQQAELTAADAATGDLSGSSVAIYGSTAVVGAPSNISNPGAGYVFVLPSQRAELTAAGAAAGDLFGSSVAIYGSTAVVGAPGSNAGTGAAYVFTSSRGTWSQRAKLTAAGAAAGDEFGSAVTLSGSTAVVGAPGKNSNTGAAYVFTGSGGTWTQQAKLTAADAATHDQFGYTVAIYGSTAVVAAPFKKSGTGAAYVFTGSGSTWTQRAKLTAADAATNDLFGISAAISGSTAVLGAPGKNSFTGAAYVYTGSGSTWTQRAKLTATDGFSGDYFGNSVALSGSTAVVGAPLKGANSGAAYVFTGSGATWTQQAELSATDATTGDEFGISAAISSSTAVIGANGKNTGAGAAYVFTGSGATWTQQAKLTATDAATGDHFGVSVAISGSAAVVGANGKNTDTGAAYVFAGV